MMTDVFSEKDSSIYSEDCRDCAPLSPECEKLRVTSEDIMGVFETGAQGFELYARDDCYMDYVLEDKDIRYCRRMEYQDTNLTCLAVVNSDETYCEKAAHLKDYCYYKLAIDMDNPELCPKAGFNEDICESYFFCSREMESDWPQDCDKCISRDRALCEKRENLKKAIIGNDLELCEETGSYVYRCEAQVKYSGIDDWQDCEDAEKLENDRSGYGCYYAVAIRTGDSQLCSKIPDGLLYHEECMNFFEG